MYYGCRNERFGGCGSVLRIDEAKSPGGVMSGFPCTGGFFKKEAVDLLQRFYMQENENQNLISYLKTQTRTNIKDLKACFHGSKMF